MRGIYLAQMDKTRPVLVLTAERRRSSLRKVTVAAITTTARGTVGEVPIGTENGLDHPCVITCDDLFTIPATALGRFVGFLLPHQEADLARAIIEAFDLDVDLED